MSAIVISDSSSWLRWEITSSGYNLAILCSTSRCEVDYRVSNRDQSLTKSQINELFANSCKGVQVHTRSVSGIQLPIDNLEVIVSYLI